MFYVTDACNKVKFKHKWQKIFSARDLFEPTHSVSTSDWQMFSLCGLEEKVQKVLWYLV